MTVVGEKAKERYFFLFNDLLIAAKEKSKKKEKRYEMDFMVGDMGTITLIDDEVKADPYRFILKTQGKQYCLSTPDKSAWMELIESTKKNTLRLLNRTGLSLKEVTEPDSILEITKEQLIQQIIDWSKMDNAEAVLMEVKEFAAHFGGSIDGEDNSDPLQFPLDEKEEKEEEGKEELEVNKKTSDENLKKPSLESGDK